MRKFQSKNIMEDYYKLDHDINLTDNDWRLEQNKF